MPIQRNSLKLKETDIEPHTLGEHVRRRLELRLNQKAVADQLGVVSCTVLNWERSRTKPPITSIPAIIRFLGHDPFPESKTIAQRLLARRREMGW